MSIDRKTGLFGWTAADEARFAAIIHQLDNPTCVAVAHPPLHRDGQPSESCEPCRAGHHEHASAPVGPYVICRCLRCPALVVGMAS